MATATGTAAAGMGGMSGMGTAITIATIGTTTIATDMATGTAITATGTERPQA